MTYFCAVLQIYLDFYIMMNTITEAINSPSEITTSNQPIEVKHAVILAAGNGERFKKAGTMLPKVLLPVGGLKLLERSILTLKEAGIEHFYVVTGAYGDQIKTEMGKLKRITPLDVTFVDCPDYERGNGASLGAGAAQVKEHPFLLTMADHVFGLNTVKNFVQKASTEDSHLPALACDPDVEGVFDLDDATKVQSAEGKISNIGKQINQYDLIDTGLFYFPAGYGTDIAHQSANGADSVSEIMSRFIQEEGVRALSLENAVWQDVDYPGMKNEAERRLLKSLIKPTDGWVSKKINRHISTRVSLFLTRFGVTPNMMTTFVFFLTVYGAWLAGSGEYMYIALGGLIFQIASILDGCDGELARLTYKGSQFGAWYDTLTDNARYIIFFASLGYGAYQSTGWEPYFFATIIFSVLAFYVAARMAFFTWNNKGHLTNLVVSKHVDEQSKKSNHFWDVIVRNLRGIDKQDVSAFIAFILCIVGLYKVMFWLVFVGSIIVSITVTRSVKSKKDKKKGKSSGISAPDPFLFYILGVLLLCFMIYKMEVHTVADSLTTVGGSVFLVFATAIPWIFANAMSLANLVRHRVPFMDLLYVQVTGDAYNTIIPLAGLGGEPYKIKVLSSWIGIDTASRAIVQNRLIHSLTGILFTAITAGLAVYFVNLEGAVRITMIISCVIFSIIGLAMCWLTMSKVPSKVSGFVLKKLQVADDFEHVPLSFGRFFVSFFFKMLGRFLNLVEIFAIFYILGFHVGFAEVITVAAFLSMTVTLLFIIPQGIGVNEAGISSAFVILGFGAPVGLIFALVRRARVIFWALVGVVIHLTVVLIRKISAEKSVRKEMVRKL